MSRAYRSTRVSRRADSTRSARGSLSPPARRPSQPRERRVSAATRREASPAHGLPAFRPAGIWSLLLDVPALGLDCIEVSNRLLEQDVAATPMRGWGGDIGDRHVRFVFSTSLSSGSSCLVGDCTGHWRRPRPALERSLDGRNLLLSKPTDSRLAWFARYVGEDCASRQCPAGVSQPATRRRPRSPRRNRMAMRPPRRRTQPTARSGRRRHSFGSAECAVTSHAEGPAIGSYRALAEM